MPRESESPVACVWLGFVARGTLRETGGDRALLSIRSRHGRDEGRLGLMSVPVAVLNVHVQSAPNYAPYVELAKRTHQGWGSRIPGKLEKTALLSSDGSIPLLVSPVFRGGVRVNDVKHRVLENSRSNNPSVIRDLALVLLVRKCTACTDTNLFNLMIGQGRILSVDENPASTLKLADLLEMDGLDLQTAQRMDSR